MNRQEKLRELWERHWKGREAAPATRCINGHPYSPENTTYQYSRKHGHVYRRCRACRRVA